MNDNTYYWFGHFCNPRSRRKSSAQLMKLIVATMLDHAVWSGHKVDAHADNVEVRCQTVAVRPFKVV